MVKTDWCLVGEGSECQVKASRPGGAISGSGQDVTQWGAGVPSPGRSWSRP